MGEVDKLWLGLVASCGSLVTSEQLSIIMKEIGKSEIAEKRARYEDAWALTILRDTYRKRPPHIRR